MAEPAAGYCYVIAGPGGLYKIGRSVNPLARMSQIAPRDAGLELVTYVGTGNTVWLERYLHEAFSHRRVKGEWFFLSVADVRLLKIVGPEVNTVDDLPSELVAQWVLNEAKGFEWGERDDDAILPVRPASSVLNMSADWHGVLCQLASAAKMPPAWYLVMLVKDDLEHKGHRNLPPAPWESQ